MSAAREREWQELYAFFHFWVTYVEPKLQPTRKPSNAVLHLDAIQARYGRSKALEGLKQAVGDILEKTSDWHAEPLKLVNELLASHDLVTLSGLRRRYRSKYVAILKRGRIRNDTEYYLLTSVANDMSLDLPESERSALDRLIHEYEDSVA
jgi:hypothetical protein